MSEENLDQDCLFCRIASGESPSHAVYADERLYAFLDIHPIRPGHVQVIPRDHHACFDELPPDLASNIVGLGQRLAIALKRIYGVPRVGFAFTGNDIAHAHAHVVPLVCGTDITSRRYIVEEKVTFRATPRAAPSELDDTAARIRSALANGAIGGPSG